MKNLITLIKKDNIKAKRSNHQLVRIEIKKLNLLMRNTMLNLQRSWRALKIKPLKMPNKLYNLIIRNDKKRNLLNKWRIKKRQKI